MGDHRFSGAAQIEHTPPSERRCRSRDDLSRATRACLAVVCACLLVSAALAAPTWAQVPAHTDVMLVFDTTGSMRSALGEAEQEIATAAERISADLPDVQFGVAEIRDYGVYGDRDDRPWRLALRVTSDRVALTEAIGGLDAAGGGDDPEAYGRGLWESDTNPSVGWRSGARHLIVLVADDVPHDDDLNAGIPLGQQARSSPLDTGTDPGSDGRSGTADDLDWQAVLDQLNADGTPLEFVFYHGYETFLPYWSNWTARTGGQAKLAGSGDLAQDLVVLATSGATASLPPCPSGQARDPGGRCLPASSPSPGGGSPSAAKLAPIVYRAIGDSVAAGFGLHSSFAQIVACSRALPTTACDNPAESYPALVAAGLGAGGRPVDWENYAVSGSKPGDWLDARNRTVGARLGPVLAASPNLVSVTLGANDLTGKLTNDTLCLADVNCISKTLDTAKTSDNLHKLLARITTAQRQATIVVTPYHSLPIDPAGAVNLINQMVIDVASRFAQVRVAALPSFRGHGCGQLQPWMLGFKDICLHPNAAGLARYAEAVLAAWRNPDAMAPAQGRFTATIGAAGDFALAIRLGPREVVFNVASLYASEVAGGIVSFVGRVAASGSRATASGLKRRTFRVRTRLRYRSGRAPVRVKVPSALRRGARVSVRITRRPSKCLARKRRHGRCALKLGPSIRLGSVPAR